MPVGDSSYYDGTKRTIIDVQARARIRVAIELQHWHTGSLRLQ